MKAIFGVLVLVIVLAVVGSLAKKQLQAIGGGASASRNAVAASESGAFSARGSDRAGVAAPLAGAIAVDPNGATVAQQAHDMQERARANTARALEQGAQRNQRADP
ncbi:MAG TPA: hypothetical protein VH041_16680 [Caldimonas sp.]|nr:hypothetical protein [Caldimonas sp.]HEX4235928.1 hypothetical protein [Caldimonas sp.]